MQRDEIFQQLANIIKPYLPSDAAAQTLPEDADLVLQLGVSSMHMIDIIVEIEELFDIEISTEEAKSMARLGSVLDLIQQKLAGAEGKRSSAGA
jgi:acyl carrier protein